MGSRETTPKRQPSLRDLNFPRLVGEDHTSIEPPDDREDDSGDHETGGCQKEPVTTHLYGVLVQQVRIEGV